MEPKRYKFDELHRPSYDEPIGQAVYLYADDPAIVSALSIANAAREAGLVDEDGNLIKPRWIAEEDGTVVFRPTDDDTFVRVGDKVFIARAERAAGGGEQ